MLGFSCGMWELVSWPGIEPGPPALGGLGKSLEFWFWFTDELLYFKIVMLGEGVQIMNSVAPFPFPESRKQTGYHLSQ